jgi:aspartate kinase
MIAQGSPSEVTFTVPAATLAQAADVLEKNRAAIGYAGLATDLGICKVSIVGVGIRSDPAIAARMFATLAERKIDILAIATSEIKVSVLIPEDYTELAVRVLHTAFGLDAEDAV